MNNVNLFRNDMRYSILMTVFKDDNPMQLIVSINSMINQTVRTDDFVIVIDGNIPESIVRVLDDFDKNYPNIFNFIKLETNVGLGKALSIGIHYCKNELVARMDADDFSVDYRCEKLLSEFHNDTTLDIVGSNVDEFVEDISIIIGKRVVPVKHDDILRFSKLRDPFNHPTVMFKKSSVLMSGNYSDYRKNQDTDLWIKMLSHGCKAKNIDESLVKFRFSLKTYKRRKNLLNVRLLLKIRYKAYLNKYISLWDFIRILISQVGVLLMPIKFQKWLYTKFLRNK